MACLRTLQRSRKRYQKTDNVQRQKIGDTDSRLQFTLGSSILSTKKAKSVLYQYTAGSLKEDRLATLENMSTQPNLFIHDGEF